MCNACKSKSSCFHGVLTLADDFILLYMSKKKKNKINLAHIHHKIFVASCNQIFLYRPLIAIVVRGPRGPIEKHLTSRISTRRHKYMRQVQAVIARSCKMKERWPTLPWHSDPTSVGGGITQKRWMKETNGTYELGRLLRQLWWCTWPLGPHPRGPCYPYVPTPTSLSLLEVDLASVSVRWALLEDAIVPYMRERKRRRRNWKNNSYIVANILPHTAKIF
jgi:hypothetical protein